MTFFVISFKHNVMSELQMVNLMLNDMIRSVDDQKSTYKTLIVTQQSMGRTHRK